MATGRNVERINEIIGADTLGYLSTEHVVQLAKNAKCGFCTACFTGEYAVKPEEVLSTDIHERHLNDRPKNEKKLESKKMEKSYSESYAAAGVDITAGYRPLN